jgi:Flp pilus assembly pilin Flp
MGSLIMRARAGEGQTMAEYGILVAVIAVVVIVAAAAFGTSVTNLFSSSAHKV